MESQQQRVHLLAEVVFPTGHPELFQFFHGVSRSLHSAIIFCESPCTHIVNFEPGGAALGHVRESCVIAKKRLAPQAAE
jgi:hypothetical protein